MNYSKSPIIAVVTALANEFAEKELSAPENADICEDGKLDPFDLCLMRSKLIYG